MYDVRHKTYAKYDMPKILKSVFRRSYRPERFSVDIAIMRLQQRVNIIQGFQAPICIKQGDFHEEPITLIGFGLDLKNNFPYGTDTLQFADVRACHILRHRAE
jgi:hypothetical protein